MTDYKEKTAAEFTELLASALPVPGGGGASALAGAIGIALGDMVGELTVGKKKYKDVEEDIKALMEKAQGLRIELLECINEDAEAFAPLSKAYGIPKDDPEREETLEKCLRQAARAPLHIFDLCCEAIEVTAEFSKKGSKLMLSDAASGAVLLEGALKAAAVNVKVNTALMKDREYADEIDRHIEDQLSKYSEIAEKTYHYVFNRLQKRG